MAFVVVAKKEDIPQGAVRVFTVDGRSLAVARVQDERFYAIDNLCTHDNGPLGEGRLLDETVECPRHGARFDVRTGAVKSLPAVRPVKAYPVRVEGDEVQVDVA